ncbi:MAG: hypothetical protein P4L57_05005 [Rhizomicrobium sp.]|nr:hypothetical protein [Rhizomicrobium sp.]
MTETLVLTPFLEPEDPTFPDNDRFVAGFKDEDGNRCGTLVPLSRDTLEALILTSTAFEPVMDADGTVQACPDALVVSDEMYGEMLQGDLLPKVAVDELVANTLELNRNEPDDGEDGVLPVFANMRNRLVHALELVDAEISRRSRKSDVPDSESR